MQGLMNVRESYLCALEQGTLVCGPEMASPDDAEIPSPFLKEGKLKKEG